MKGVKVSVLLVLFIMGLLVGCSDDSTSAPTQSVYSSAFDISSLPKEELSDAETEGIIFIREEEKLARDTYLVLGDTWGARVFENISRSESRHMEAMKQLIDRYELEDPVKSDEIGVFTNETLKALYDTLTTMGKESLEAALRVGAAIEEIDILDIQKRLDENVDNQDITLVYTNLMKGSRNHLRAFVKNLANIGVTYEPQYLDQETYDAIISTPMERGRL